MLKNANGKIDRAKIKKIYETKKQLFKKLSILFDIKEIEIKPNLVLQNIHSMDSLKHMELISFIEKSLKRQLNSKKINKIKKFQT